jgi:hypothetical protein
MFTLLPLARLFALGLPELIVIFAGEWGMEVGGRGLVDHREGREARPLRRAQGRWPGDPAPRLAWGPGLVDRWDGFLGALLAMTGSQGVT